MFQASAPIFEEKEKEDSLPRMLTKWQADSSAIEKKIRSGTPVNERNPRTEEAALHVLYRQGALPLELSHVTRLLIEHGADVNLLDGRGHTPLSYLILHANRGLLYHTFPVPELKRMIDLAYPKAEILAKVMEVDSRYQEEVFKTLQVLIENGAQVNAVADTCPMIPHTISWSETFEHKLMQQDHRWQLLMREASMEISTYSIFNSLSNLRVANVLGLAPIHLAAWRGDARCLELLLQHGCQVNRTGDGRNALHFLYHYCNKPAELPKCTNLLLNAGVDPQDEDEEGNTPMFLLLYHIHIKRSYIKYLANAYSVDDSKLMPCQDNYHQEILDCLELLVQQGASLTHTNSANRTLLHSIFDKFEQSLNNCDEEFQLEGHYLVPYSFTMQPLVKFTATLCQRAPKQINVVDMSGKSALHCLVMALCNLNLNTLQGSPQDILECFHMLLTTGANPNILDNKHCTPTHLLGKLIITRLPFTKGQVLQIFQPVLDLLTLHGGDLNLGDKNRNTVLHGVMGLRHWSQRHAAIQMTHWGPSWMKIDLELLHNFVQHLLRSGCDPSVSNLSGILPLSMLLHHHDDDHRPTDNPRTSHRHSLQQVALLLCNTMRQSLVYDAFTFYQAEVWPSAQQNIPHRSYEISPDLAQDLSCDTCRLVSQTMKQCQTLRHMTKLVIWRTLGHRFIPHLRSLPLPSQLLDYIWDLQQS